jgi:hypothetical protein
MVRQAQSFKFIIASKKMNRTRTLCVKKNRRTTAVNKAEGNTSLHDELKLTT